jgi:hypothetical protein
MPEGNDVDITRNPFVSLWDFRVAGRNDKRVKLLQARILDGVLKVRRRDASM